MKRSREDTLGALSFAFTAQLGISRAQQEQFHLCSALVSPVLSLLFLSGTASLLLFLAVS